MSTALNRGLDGVRANTKIRKAAKAIRDNKKLEKDKKSVAKDGGEGGPMQDMAVFNAGSYLQTIDTRKKLLVEYGMSDTWSIDEKNSGDDWVVYTRATPEKGKPDNVIAYRGSAKKRDWLTNAQIATNTFNTSPRYERSKKEFQRISTELSGSKMTTGHSLGGLIALSLGRDFGVPSVTFNRASGWDQLEDDLDAVNSVNYTTNASGGPTDAVSLASYWAPSKGEKVISVQVKEGNEGLLGAHGLDNFLPAEKTPGFLDDLNKEDMGKQMKSITKDLYEGAREIGADKTADKTSEFMKSVSWKMVLGYGTDQALKKLIEKQMITGKMAERIQSFQSFWDNPTSVAARRVGEFLKKHLGPAKDFLEGKVKGTWEEIKSRMPVGDDMSEWEPETTGWEDKWEYGLEDDNPAYREPEDGTEPIEMDELGDEPDPLEGFQEPEQFEDDEDGPGAWEDEHDPALPEEPAPETFPELDDIGGQDVLRDVELGGEETAVAAAEEGVASGMMEGVMAGGEIASAAAVAFLPFYYIHKDMKEKEQSEEDQSTSQVIRNQSIADSAVSLGFDPSGPINDFIKDHPDMETTFKNTKMEVDGVMQYDYDYDAFYGPRAAEYLKWRNDNKSKFGDRGISVEEAMTKLKETNNPFTNREEYQKNLAERRKKEKDIRSGLRYKDARIDAGAPDSKRFKVSGVTNPTFNQRKQSELERQDDFWKQHDRDKNEFIYHQTIDKKVTGEKTTDAKGNVHWRREGEQALPQKDGTFKWTQKGDTPTQKTTVTNPYYHHWKKEKHPDIGQWKWDGGQKTYVHNSVKTPSQMPRTRRKYFSDMAMSSERTGDSRSQSKNSHGDGIVEVDKNSMDGKGNVHQTLATNNNKHTNNVHSWRNDKFDNHNRSQVQRMQSDANQGTGKGIKEPNRQLYPPTASLLNPANLKYANQMHHPLDPLQPHGVIPVNRTHNGEAHPKQTPAHQVAPGENHNPFSGTPGSSEHTFGVEGKGGITMRQVHQRSMLQSMANQQMIGTASDVNFMRSVNRKEGRY